MKKKSSRQYQVHWKHMDIMKNPSVKAEKFYNKDSYQELG